MVSRRRYRWFLRSCLSVRSERRGRGEKRRRLSRERLVILEQGSMPGIGIREEYGVRQVLDQPVRVGNRNHFVVNAVHDKRGLLDVPQIGEPGSVGLLPVAERRELRGGDVASRWRVEVVLA